MARIEGQTSYISGTSHRPLPTGDGYRKAHAPQKPRPTGLDWGAHRAPDQPDTPPAPAPARRPAAVKSDRLDDMLERIRPETPATQAPAAQNPPSSEVPKREATPQEPLYEIPVAQLDTLVEGLTQACARMATDLTDIQRVLHAVRQALTSTTPPATPQTTPTRTTRPRATRRDAAPLDPAVITRAYQDGHTVVALALDHGTTPKRIRALLDDHGVERRDDRTTHSGGQPRDYSDDLIGNVRRLYLDEQLSQAEVAKRLGVAHKTVVTIMTRHDIAARQRQSGHLDGAADLKARMQQLGVQSSDIKAWAFRVGLVDRIKRGIPSQELVAAYEQAHITHQKETDPA